MFLAPDLFCVENIPHFELYIVAILIANNLENFDYFLIFLEVHVWHCEMKDLCGF